MQVNTIGPINVINAFLPLLRTASVASTARVVAISSGLADLETTTRAELGMQAPYSMSKIALNMAIAKYAATFKDDNFVFLSISPGFVKTAEEPCK